jgi:hypothetical protein
MKFLTKDLERKLIANYEANKNNEGIDHKPVVKFFGGAACTWLISEYDYKSGLMFGLCDLGAGFPELGYVSRDDLEDLRFPPFGLPIERDLHFEADKTLSEYAEEAKKAGRIVA